MHCLFTISIYNCIPDERLIENVTAHFHILHVFYEVNLLSSITGLHALTVVIVDVFDELSCAYEMALCD